MPLSGTIILQMHRYLLSHTGKTYAGSYKWVQNYIQEIDAQGNTRIRFTPLEPFETPIALETLCKNYVEAITLEVIDPLILIPICIGDFFNIHPCTDGKGRVSRLLTTLLLYQSGFMVGRYISLEQKVAESKDEYYQTLSTFSEGWHSQENTFVPFVRYFLRIVLQSYKDLESRLGSAVQNLPSLAVVRKAVAATLGTFTKREILERCPTVGSSSVEAALKRLLEEGYIQRIGGGRSTAYIQAKTVPDESPSHP